MAWVVDGGVTPNYSASRPMAAALYRQSGSSYRDPNHISKIFLSIVKMAHSFWLVSSRHARKTRGGNDKPALSNAFKYCCDEEDALQSPCGHEA